MVYRVEKSYVDKLVVRNPLHFNLLSTSPELFIDKTYDIDLIAVRQDVNNLESSVVVQEQEFAIHLALYGLS